MWDSSAEGALQPEPLRAEEEGHRVWEHPPATNHSPQVALPERAVPWQAAVEQAVGWEEQAPRSHPVPLRPDAAPGTR